jgi:threonine dehydrogenase-like Zn-dependent dehydrogenase
MFAQIFHQPGDMRYEQRPVPTVNANELLIRVRACGICGSDLAFYNGKVPLETHTGSGPLVLGHEFSGEIVGLGAMASDTGLFKEGDRVSVDPVQNCGACEECRKGMVNICDHKTVLGVSVDGGYAEYCRVKLGSVFRLPEKLSYEEGAFSEPLACALHGITKLEIALGQTCIIIGPGPLGLLMVQLAKLAGAGKVILVGTRDYRLAIGQSLGADVLINVAENGSLFHVQDVVAYVSQLTNGRLAERVITPTSDTAAMRLALELSGKRSIIVFFGDPGETETVDVPIHVSLAREKTIKFSVRSAFTWPTATELLEKGLVNVKPLLTNRYRLHDLKEGLKAVEQRRDNILKGMVVYEA